MYRLQAIIDSCPNEWYRTQAQIELDELKNALATLLNHAREKYPHFESERGQAELAHAAALLDNSPR